MKLPETIVAIFFFLSGFLSLLYQTVWLRLAFASFGVITPVISVLLSIFMLGLALGAWLAGKYVSNWQAAFGRSAILTYGACEAIIGIGALAVPFLFQVSDRTFLTVSPSDSASYMFASALCIGLAILPFTTAMGATFPLGMRFLQEARSSVSKTSFGFLYVANVAGAVLGALLPTMVLIETMGFRLCLICAGSLNLLIGCAACIWGWRRGLKPETTKEAVVGASEAAHPAAKIKLLILFMTGLVSMGLEVVWVRAITPDVGTTVGAFALLLAVYLISTAFGSWLLQMNRRHDHVKSKETLLSVLSGVSLLPLIIMDPHVAPPALRQGLALLTISPFCAVLGYLTPMLVDDLSEGQARLGGRAYAINVLGCIVGPLLAGYIILPVCGVKLAQLIFALPLLALALYCLSTVRRSPAQSAGMAISVGLLIIGAFCHSWEEWLPAVASDVQMRRDYVGTTLNMRSNGIKTLCVNGVNMAAICDITKDMAHLPLSTLSHKPTSALTICLGNGTTFRSLASWGIDVTAVELVPSVRDSFSYYFPDAARVLEHNKVVVDDGRRFLRRTHDTYDVITIDPPPPIEASSSGLLYSKEFYALVKDHLKPGGIFCAWYAARMTTDTAILHAVTRSLTESFPFIRAYCSTNGLGYLFLCSMTPLPPLDAAGMWQAMPEAARADFLEASSGRSDTPSKDQIAQLIAGEVPLNSLMGSNPTERVTDDQPFNEYFYVRRSR